MLDSTMDFDFIVSIVKIAKYALVILGLIGLVMLFIGKSRRQKNIMTLGIYILVLSIIFGVCGFFVSDITKQKVGQKYEEVYYEYQNQQQR